MKKKIKMPVSKGTVKVPVVIQLEALECGAACLAMVLAYYGKWLPLEQVRRDCGVSQNGSKASNILKVARVNGLEASGFRYGVETLKEKGTFPGIIFWNNCHFVVICGFKKNKAILNDPAKGTYEVPMEEFKRGYSGVYLKFAPTEEFVPSGKQTSMWDYAKKRLGGAKAAFAFVVVTTVITSLIGIIMPLFAKVYTDRILTRTNLNWFMPIITGIALISLVQIIVAIIQQIYSLKLNGKISIVANSEYMWHVLRLPDEFFSQRLTGDISARQTTNATIVNSLISTIAPLAIEGGMMIFYLVIMINYSFVLALAGIVSAAINILVHNYIAKKIVNMDRVASRDRALLNGAMVAGIKMIETIKSQGAEEGYFAKLSGYDANAIAADCKADKISLMLGSVSVMVNMVANTVVFMGSVYLCQQGNWSVGMITAFTGFLTGFLTPVLKFAEATKTIQEMRTEMERVEDVMNYPIDPSCVERDKSEVSSEMLTGKIELKNVTFGYDRLEPPLIENFNLTLTPGKKVAFVGTSGCGKSTIAKLIAGIQRPWSGEILYDGKHIDEIDRYAFTTSLAMVDQQISLFEDTFLENVRMWDKAVENWEVILAAKDAGIYDEIMQKQGGINTVLAEGGNNLSGGQRQRVEIARALVQDPTILIMDEATSALDAKTEYEVVKAIKERGISCVVVAHRLSTIRDCDEIIVLEHGEVMERGTHEELYAQNGLYTQLVSND